MSNFWPNHQEKGGRCNVLGISGAKLCCCTDEAIAEHHYVLCQGIWSPWLTVQTWDISDAALEAVDPKHALSEQYLVLTFSNCIGEKISACLSL